MTLLSNCFAQSAHRQDQSSTQRIGILLISSISNWPVKSFDESIMDFVKSVYDRNNKNIRFFLDICDNNVKYCLLHSIDIFQLCLSESLLVLN